MQGRTRLVFYLLASMVFQVLCHADVAKLPYSDQKALGNSHFQIILTTTNLPRPVFKFCADDNGRLAEPGQDWEESDVITNDKLPTKRMIWAVTDGYYYVVHYESGGIGLGFHFVVAKLKKGKNKMEFVWHGVGESTKDYPAFLVALHTGKIDDHLPYFP